ncbi:MAG TPA: OPT/YSL family transporter, partial [Legionellaceae bacterium]|nr:OPT/YSL family transporter [Legionellaceae bacterium]
AILRFGFIFSAICGYFSGLLGVSGSPGSGIIISGALMIAVLFKTYLHINFTIHFTDAMLLEVEGIIMIAISILACIAAISCDNIQDLKVGHIIGATPWKQQLMLLLGILIVSIITPFIMQLLLDVYGIAGDLQSHSDPAQVLSAPPAAMIASLVEAIFKDTISWILIGGGALFILALITCNYCLNRSRIQFSILGIATGMYLPLSITVPLFIGSLLSAIIKKKIQNDENISKNEKEMRIQSGFLIASGMLCGATLMQVILAGIFALCHNSDILNMMPQDMKNLSYVLSVGVTLILFYWIYRDTTAHQND